MKRIYSSLLALSILATGVVACNDDQASSPDFLNENLAWYGNNRQALNQMIFDFQDSNAIAVFDFDNTMIKNDIGDQVTFWMINHNMILQPPAKDWSAVSPLLTLEARNALNAACDTQGDAGQAMTTDTSTAESRACADEIYSVYANAETTAGDVAYTTGATQYIEPAYAFTVQLQKGYTPEELQAMANQVIDFALGNEIDQTQQVGNNTEVTAWLRQYEQIVDLIHVLQEQDFNVWVVSASSDPVVKAFAARFGIAADHVIGVRTVLENGESSYRFQGCGTFADGTGDIITYRDGKRCWINKVIFGIEDAQAQLEPSEGVLFVAGDSDTDLSMLVDADYQLVINRNKTELMCNAYYNDAGQGNWLINPMFIQPKGKYEAGYDCAPYGLPNQEDTVFGN